MKIGDKVYQAYYDREGKICSREFRVVKIENDWCDGKNKNGGILSLPSWVWRTKNEKDGLIWKEKNFQRLSEAVDNISDPDLLKQVHDLAGFKKNKSKKLTFKQRSRNTIFYKIECIDDFVLLKRLADLVGLKS